MTCQRCDASAVPRSVTVGPYGAAVWWLAKLYSSSYGHHGLSPCSTDIGQGALQVGLHKTRLTSLGALLLTPAAHSLCKARHRPALTMRLHEQNDGLHGYRAGLWLGDGLHMMQCNAGACLKASRPTAHAVGCWVALDHPPWANGAHIGHRGAHEPDHVRWSLWP